MAIRALLAAVVLLLAAVPLARADGDPASDVLPSQPVFYGSALDLKSRPAAQLDALVKEAKRRGYPVNVAVISRLEDMGSATQYWNDMDNYGEFLAGEIACCVKGRLLIVMPSGLGVIYIGHSSQADRKALSGLPAPGSVPNLLPAAINGVIKLAAASGVNLVAPDVTPAPNGVDEPITHASAPNIVTQDGASTGNRSLWLYLLPIIVVVVVSLALITRRRLRERGVESP